MIYLLTSCCSWLACLLPRRIRYALGCLLGQVCWLIVPQRRKHLAIENCRLALKVDQAEAIRIVKASTTRFGPMFMEVLTLPNWQNQDIRQKVKLEGQAYLDEALALGKGVVLATAHSGNWEVMGAALAMYGYPLIAVAQKQTNADMDRFINEYRTKTGMHVTYKTGVREMVRLLGEGKVIGLLMDQDAHDDGIFVDFFGRKASTPQGPAALARLKGAPAVAAFITQTEPGRHKIVISPPFYPEKTADREADLRTTTAYLTQLVEQHIRQKPEEWFWLHNRWKTLPKSDPENTSV